MPELAMAARVGDPITHSAMLGIALAGIGIGLVVGIAFAAASIATAGGIDVIAAGGIAAVVVVAGAISTICLGVSLGFLLGKLAGWASSFLSLLDQVTGKIKEGAGTVFIGPGLPAAARYQDAVECQEPMSTYMGATLLGTIICPGIGTLIAAGIVYANSAHTGATMAQGSKTVLTEGKSQSRVGDKTTCGGKVSKGCETVLVGGPPNAEVSWTAEIPVTLDTIITWIDRIGIIAGIVGAGAGLWKLALEEGWELGLLATKEGIEVLVAGADGGLELAKMYLEHEEDKLRKIDDPNSEAYKEQFEKVRRARDVLNIAQGIDKVVHFKMPKA